MKIGAIFILALTLVGSLDAQHRIDTANLFHRDSRNVQSGFSVSATTSDTLISQPDSTVAFFTTRLGDGEKILFQYPIQLAEGATSFTISEILMPFYGGSFESNGLSPLNVRLFMWVGGDSLSSYQNLQPQAQSDVVEARASINELRTIRFPINAPSILSDTLVTFALFVSSSNYLEYGTSPVFSSNPFQLTHQYLDSVIVNDTTISPVWTDHNTYWESGSRDVGDIIFTLIGDSEFPEIDGEDEVTSNENSPLLPSEFEIRAYPNPFNPSTTIEIQSDQVGTALITVVDMFGRTILNHSVRLGTNRTTKQLDMGSFSSGNYTIVVRLNGMMQTKRITLLK